MGGSRDVSKSIANYSTVVGMAGTIDKYFLGGPTTGWAHSQKDLYSLIEQSIEVCYSNRFE